jgi:hypothetical protein
MCHSGEVQRREGLSKASRNPFIGRCPKDKSHGLVKATKEQLGLFKALEVPPSQLKHLQAHLQCRPKK